MPEEDKKAINFSVLLIIVVFLTIILRVIYWLQACNEAWFISPGMDPAFYTNWADDILSGKGGDYFPFPRAPLYPYILAAIRGIFGTSWLFPRLLNLLADIFTVVVIFQLAHRISGKKAAIVAASLFSFTGASIYFSGEILMTSLAVAASAGFLYTFASCWQRPRFSMTILSGFFLVFLSLLRPNALILLPFILIIIIHKAYKSFPDLKNKIALPVSHLLTVIILLLPVIITNYQASGKLIPISTQGGVNFYIGNAKGANGWSSELPGYGANWQDSDALQLAQTNAGKILKPAEVSGQLWRMGWREISDNPVHWIKISIKKLMLLINAREIGNNRALSLPLEASPFLKVLFLISLGALFPFAMVGTANKPMLRQVLTPDATIIMVKTLLLFILVFGGSLVLFFVNTRYRMPLMPAIAVLAGIGIVKLIDEITQRKRHIASDSTKYEKLHYTAITPECSSLLEPDQGLLYGKTRSSKLEHSGVGWRYFSRKFVLKDIVILLSASIISFPGWIGDDFESPAQAHFIAGNAFMRQGKMVKALECYKQTSLLKPDYPELHLNKGVALMTVGDTIAANDEFLLELLVTPNSSKAENNLGVIAETDGNLDNAYSHFIRALEYNPDLNDARINAARIKLKMGDIYLQAGDFLDAEYCYLEAGELHGTDPRPFHRLAIIAVARGDWEDAIRRLNEALIQNPDYKPAIELFEKIIKNQ
ncbi:MAG: tetratricopeptide repeat protein [Candidatus Hatepunaea meridiana]|nr:tetratricopeptide repeat protein [Candidatus Hatepunaea meridiana]